MQTELRYLHHQNVILSQQLDWTGRFGLVVENRLRLGGLSPNGRLRGLSAYAGHKYEFQLLPWQFLFTAINIEKAECRKASRLKSGYALHSFLAQSDI
jgi:hypothetical protein